jgi:spore coat protein U-like protein
MAKDGSTVYTKTVPIDEATATITVPELNAGKYTVKVAYSGDNNYNPNTAEVKFEVAKANATVEIHVYDIIYGDIEELTVTCNAPGNVTIYVNGASITLPLEEGYGHTLFAALLNAYSGKAQWDLENLAVGTYPASVHYNGNENYNEADDDDVFHVIKKETSVRVSVDDIKVGEDAVINVELSPSAAPGKLTIAVDGKEYHVTPKNGMASLKVPGLKAGNHTVTVSYPGSENYTDSSNETTFTVSKVKPDVDVSAPTIKVGEDGKITVTLPKDATGKVTIEIDGKNYTSQIKDGKAVFTVSGLKVGKHPIKVFYTGDDKYESSVVDGGYIKVIEENNNGSNDHKGHANGIDLSTKATGNPVLALLFVLVFLGIIPLRRKKDEEDED